MQPVEHCACFVQARAPPHPVLPRKRLSAHNNVLLQTLRERFPLTASLTGTWHLQVHGTGYHALPPASCGVSLSIRHAAHCIRTGEQHLTADTSQFAGLGLEGREPVSSTEYSRGLGCGCLDVTGSHADNCNLPASHCAGCWGLARAGQWSLGSTLYPPCSACQHRQGWQAPSSSHEAAKCAFPHRASFRSSLRHTCRSC